LASHPLVHADRRLRCRLRRRTKWHGTNAFFRDDDDRVFRTYLINSRGDEAMGGTWSYLDITALGRQEEWEDSPEGYPQTPPYYWWSRHDEYDRPEAAAEMAEQISARYGRSGEPVTGDNTLRIERTFQAPVEAVFRAWTTEEVMRRWWQAAHGWETTEAEVDLRVGGAVRVVMRDPARTRSTAAAGSTRRSTLRPASPSPGSGTATRGER
jgi:hypothetical protein